MSQYAGCQCTGNRVPLKYCRIKGHKGQYICKQGYPRKVMKDKKGKINKTLYRVRVVCQGVARELELKTKGRRNALGSIAGPRRCEYFAQTSAALAALTQSNTNLQCNYRVPLTDTTHDPACKSKKCVGNRTSNRRLCLIAQRAMKQLTGYFGGYLSKKQKVGQFELKKSVAALTPLKEKLLARNLKSASTQLAHMANRMFVTLEGKGILRPSIDDFMLSSRYKQHDPLAAEFIRTFRHQNFHGKFFLDRYDAMAEGTTKGCGKARLPPSGRDLAACDEVAFYGYRNTDHLFSVSLRGSSYNGTNHTACNLLAVTTIGACGHLRELRNRSRKRRLIL